MNQDVQRRLMYLFERVGEPLYFGPRGSNNTYYMVPMDGVDSKTRHAATEFRRNMASSGANVQVKSPSKMPDLSILGAACPRTTLFSYFIPSHREAAGQLRQLLLNQKSLEDFLAMSCVCRDNDLVNPRLWIYAFASACLRRSDLRGFRMPAIWEVEPDQFVGPNVVRMAQRQAVLPSQDRSRIVIPRNFTADDSNPENRVAYFREDIGVNSHHWHWHLVYPLDAPAGQRDRKGELFYWMHHDILARYDAERLANKLGRVKRHDLSGTIPEGYFPKLYDTNSGIIWGTRQEGTLPRGVDRLSDTRFPVRLDFEDLKKWFTRVSEAIDTGVVIRTDGQSERLTPETGINVLGNLLEASNESINRQFYGDYHNMGHVSIAFAHDPNYRHREEMGVMGDSNTAMRDPVFYRWHKHVDELFDKYKGTLQPYSQQELSWQGIQVTELSVQTNTGNRERNILVTNWMSSDIDLSRGLDFGRTNENNLGPIWASLTHLNHEEFSYTIRVRNTGRGEVSGTVRLFMAPRLSESRRRFDMTQQRPLFFTVDKFTTVLRAGDNVITRRSTESTVTIPWEQTFRDLERSVQAPNAQQSICSCGWPQHMLLPRGTTDGMIFDLYCIITNGTDDAVQRNNPGTTASQRQGCRDSVTYCGILDEKYPDAKPMGYPFDRYPRLRNNRPVPNLDAFVDGVPNSRTTQVRIVHRDVVLSRTGGAPENMPTVQIGTPTSSPGGSRPSSPGGSRPSSPGGSKPSSPGRSPSRGRGPNNQSQGGKRWPQRGRDRSRNRGQSPESQYGGRGGGWQWSNRSPPRGWDRPYQGYGHHHDRSPERGRGGGRRNWPGRWGYGYDDDQDSFDMDVN